MKAVQFDRYGPPEVLTGREVARPVCGSKELLVKIRAAGVNPKDCLVRKGKFRWFTGRRFPLGLGHDFAGTVVSVGRKAEGFQVGDAVYGMTNGWLGRTYAEYAAVKASETALMPSTLRFEQAAAVPLAAQTALQALRDIAHVSRGQRVLINGASGGVGTFAVQIAGLLGAHVTAVCSGRNVDMVAEMGAHQVLDYTRDAIEDLAEPVDAFFDVFGNRRFQNMRPILSPDGCFISTVPGRAILNAVLRSRLERGPKAHLVVVASRVRDLGTLSAWIASGRLLPVLDRVFPLAAAEQAHRYIETRRARGKVVLKVD